MEIILLLIGLTVGFLLGWLAGSSRVTGLSAQVGLLRERLTAADSAGSRQQDIAVTVAPLAAALTKVESHLRDLESTRTSAYASLTQQVAFARETSEELREQTSSLVTALRAPQARGRWGEMQLRRVVELAGMVEHCDFSEQVSVTTEHGLLRPDLVVRLAGGKEVVVDAKVTLSAYLQAAESRDPDVVADRMAAHARHLREHVHGLAAKEYWRSFEPTPEFVVLFVPGDAFLAPALEHDPALLEDAMAARVFIATPTTLIAMLRTIAYSWQQEALTEHARSVFELGRELYRRLGTLGDHVDKLGRTLGRAVDDYNKTVGSLERNVLVQARRMADLKITDGDLVAPRPVDEALRRVTSPELVGTPYRSADADVDPDAEAAAELPLTGPQIVDHAGETRDLRVVHRPGA
jgi:DNA recombination protein RmuC